MARRSTTGHACPHVNVVLELEPGLHPRQVAVVIVVAAVASPLPVHALAQLAVVRALPLRAIPRLVVVRHCAQRAHKLTHALHGLHTHRERQRGSAQTPKGGRVATGLAAVCAPTSAAARGPASAPGTPVAAALPP